MGKEDASGTLMVDSGGFSLPPYKSWTNTKYGKIYTKEYYKLHLLQKIYGKIVTCYVYLMIKHKHLFRNQMSTPEQ